VVPFRTSQVSLPPSTDTGRCNNALQAGRLEGVTTCVFHSHGRIARGERFDVVSLPPSTSRPLQPALQAIRRGLLFRFTPTVHGQAAATKRQARPRVWAIKFHSHRPRAGRCNLELLHPVRSCTLSNVSLPPSTSRPLQHAPAIAIRYAVTGFTPTVHEQAAATTAFRPSP
jgi:hypothetical protein